MTIHIILMFVVYLLIIATVIYIVKLILNNNKEKAILQNEYKMKRLVFSSRIQAYERLVLMLSRMDLNSIVMQNQIFGSNILDFQQRLHLMIRDEFNHNLSQQLFVSKTAWDLTKAAKETLLQHINYTAEQIEDKTDTSSFIEKLLIGQHSDNVNESNLKAINYLKDEIGQNYFLQNS